MNWVRALIVTATVVGVAAAGRKVYSAITLPRGMRNNNPGNIKLTNTAWRGKVPRHKNTDGVFEQFTDPVYGTRAMIKTLISYIKGDHNTIEKIIHRYAPSSENNTLAYISAISKATGIARYKKLDPTKETLKKLVQSMAHHENGRAAVSTNMFNQAYAKI